MVYNILVVWDFEKVELYGLQAVYHFLFWVTHNKQLWFLDHTSYRNDISYGSFMVCKL